MNIDALFLKLHIGVVYYQGQDAAAHKDKVIRQVRGEKEDEYQYCQQHVKLQ